MAMGTQAEVVGFKEVGGSALEIKTRAGIIVYRSDTTAAVLASAPPAAELPAPPPPSPISGIGRTSARARPAPAPPPARSRMRNPNLIEGPEMRGVDRARCVRPVQEARPLWLHSRGVVSIQDPTAGVLQVYLNGMQSAT